MSETIFKNYRKTLFNLKIIEKLYFLLKNYKKPYLYLKIIEKTF